MPLLQGSSIFLFQKDNIDPLIPSCSLFFKTNETEESTSDGQVWWGISLSTFHWTCHSNQCLTGYAFWFQLKERARRAWDSSTCVSVAQSTAYLIEDAKLTVLYRFRLNQNMVHSPLPVFFPACLLSHYPLTFMTVLWIEELHTKHGIIVRVVKGFSTIFFTSHFFPKLKSNQIYLQCLWCLCQLLDLWFCQALAHTNMSEKPYWIWNA